MKTIKPRRGFNRNISRRDMLNGIAISTSALAAYSALGPPIVFAGNNKPFIYAPEKDPNYYPPSRTGIRGNHPGSFEMGHARAWNGAAWKDVSDTNEDYDLVVVGGGISGLAAAYAYRKSAGAGAKILVIDNHDDFGGNAKRVEFYHEGKTYMVPGGSGFMETPYFSQQSKALVEEIGISFSRLEQGQSKNIRLAAFDMKSGLCFDKESYGKAVTVVDHGLLPMNGRDENGNYLLLKHISNMPFTESVKKELLDFLTAERNVFEKLSPTEQEAALYTMSYNTFLTQYCNLSQEAVDALFIRESVTMGGATAEAVPLFECLSFGGLPGVHAMGPMGEQLQKQLESMPPFEGHYGFDGNAIIARHFIKRLLPAVTGAETMEEITTARFNYARLDEKASNIRIRLNSMVIDIRTIDTGKKIAVSYIRGGQAQYIRAKHCIYTGHHRFLPHICPEVPDEQKKVMQQNSKLPFLVANVFLRKGKPFQELGAASFHFPGRLLTESTIWGRTLGDHSQVLNADEPVVMYMIGIMVDPHSGLPPEEQYRRGRRKLLSMSFEDYEVEVKEQLESLLAGTSFDIEKDVLGLIVNRWPHAVRAPINTLFDPGYEEGRRPFEIARKPFGRIAIAGGDASVFGLANEVIDEGLRAVEELLG